MQILFAKLCEQTIILVGINTILRVIGVVFGLLEIYVQSVILLVQPGYLLLLADNILLVLLFFQLNVLDMLVVVGDGLSEGFDFCFEVFVAD